MKNRIPIASLAAIIGIALSFGSTSNAADITWTSQGTITNENVIQANVTSAFNLWNQNTNLEVTTNSQTVTFASTASGSITSNGVTLTVPIENPGFMNAGIFSIAGVWDGPNVDADFETIMDSFAHTQVSNPSNGTFTLSGLTVGQQYSVQLLASDMRAGIGDIRTIRFDDGLGNSTATVIQNTAPSFIGTFTANATTQAFGVFSTATSGSSGSVLNAVTLSAIPEPSFAAITSFEGAGATGVINHGAKTIALTVPFGTDLATLAPTFTLNSGTSDQTSGVVPSPDFATQNPVNYVVTDTDTDPDTINTYSVTVTVAPETATLVINLGTSPAGTTIASGAFIGTGPTNLPLPSLPAGSILRSIAVDATLELPDNENYANDLTLLFDTTAPTDGGNFSLGITSPDATADFSPTQTLTWAGGGDGVGTSLTETRTDDQWTGDIDLANSDLFLGNAFASGDGTWSGTITLTYEVGSGGGNDYSTWATGSEPFNGDANGDGVTDGIAFLLGAATPATAATSLLPAVSQSGGNLVMEFDCLATAARGGSVLNLQYDGDLVAPWTSVLVPGAVGNNTVGNVSFVATANAALIHIVATIDDATEAAAGKLFGRLEGVE
jgi:hypothetical protein